MIVIVNYGVGNLKSVLKAVEKVGGKAEVSLDRDKLRDADGIIFPGVGAFKTAIEKLKDVLDVINVAPKFGICLGMQLFATRSYEGGVHEGLNVMAGEVLRFPSDVGKVPHMGWNDLKIIKDSEILDGIPDGSLVYFVHSYYLKTDERFVVAQTDYGITFPSVVEKDEWYGVQFHPEKSGKVGLEILKNFLRLAKR